MTRRGAIIGAILLGAGNLMAQDSKTYTSGQWKIESIRLQITFGDVGGLKDLVVTFSDGTSVTFTEADIKRELTGPPGGSRQ